MAAVVANDYIAGRRVRRQIIRYIETDGEAEFAINATVYEGPDRNETSVPHGGRPSFRPYPMTLTYPTRIFVPPAGVSKRRCARYAAFWTPARCVNTGPR